MSGERIRNLRLIASALLAVGAARPVAALDAPAELRRCAAVTADAQRLQCYDRLAAAVQAPTAPAVAATAATRAAPATASAPATTAPPPATAAAPVGVSAPRIAPAAPPPTPAPQSPSSAGDIKEFGVSNGPLQTKIAAGRIKSITATVAGLSTRAGGEQVVTLDNDQVWQQNGPWDYFPVKPGDKIEISEGVLGSYTMWAPSIRRASKVTRIR